MKNKKRKLYQLQRRAWLDVARPLEMYIIVFAVFFPPAVLMCTTWCESRDVFRHMCSHPAELALAFRSLGSAAVFFGDRDHRTRALQPGVLARKLRRRFCSGACAKGRVRFEDGAGERFLPSDHDVGGARGGVRFADAEVVMVEGDAGGEQHEMQPTAAGGDGELHAPYLALVDSDGETAGSGA